MSTFLASTDNIRGTSPAVLNIIQGNQVRIASAFLGMGAEDQVPLGSRLICDIGMGGTNPRALRALSESLGDNLRHLPHFHAKIYLSDRGCFIGSANLSNSGVGFLSQGTLVEAGVLLSLDEAAAIAAAEWFESVWQRASVIGPRQIATAKMTWKASKRGQPQGERVYGSFREALEDPNGVAQEWRYIVTRDEHPRDFDQREGAAREQAGWDPAEQFEIYSGLEDIDALDGYYIALHRGPRGGVYRFALQFNGKLQLPGEQVIGAEIASYFTSIDWPESIPHNFDLRAAGQLSAGIRGLEDRRIGRSLTATELLNALGDHIA